MSKNEDDESEFSLEDYVKGKQISKKKYVTLCIFLWLVLPPYP